jgi:protein-L-isoaspartate(D-aspartate) O-methyltransferase
LTVKLYSIARLNSGWTFFSDVTGGSYRSIFYFFLIFLSLNCQGKNQRQKNTITDEYKQMRLKMVEYQIESRGVRDQRVLKAMREVPRHLFVPEYLQDQAYNDEPLPIGSGQTISQPYIVAYMTEQIQLQGKERVLEIGTGSGYQAAILAELVDTVYTIEIVPELSHQAQQVLKKAGYTNILFMIGNGYYGWPEHAPFDAIVVTAAPEEIPEPLIQQLKSGGRMIIPVGDFYQELYLIRKEESGLKKERKLPVRFVPLQGEP